MKSLEELTQEFEERIAINDYHLDKSSVENSSFHGRFLTYMTQAKCERLSLTQKMNSLLVDLSDYYMGYMPKDDMDDRGWKPFLKKITKSELDKYIRSNKEYQELERQIEIMNITIDFIKDAQDAFKSRGFNIKNIIDWRKFQSGA